MSTIVRSFRTILKPSSIQLSIQRLCSSSSKPKSGAKVLSSSAAELVDEEDYIVDDENENAMANGSVCSGDVMSLMHLRRVVIYDGVCHLCHNGVKLVIKADKDRKIKFCCLQSKAAEPYMSLCGVDREDVLRRFLFIEGPGLYHQGSTAALKVMSYLPLPYSALSSLLIVPKPLREAVYDYVAKNRYNWFGKDDDCLVLQEKELLERFIDREELMYRGGPNF